ncbi:MAG: N-acetylmuramoyl-L-alanine amidase [Bacillota bacterium]
MKIILDAGHGFSTIGKRSPDGMREYEFNRVVAQYMKAALEQYEGVAVKFTHDDKRDVPLVERTNTANKWGADLLVSLHANAYQGKMGAHGGIDTFVYGTVGHSYKIAQIVQRNLIAATGLRNRGVKVANFHMLRETDMPAILIEHGFMDSTTDLPFLKSDAYRKLCGETNAKSVAEYYGLKRKSAPKPAPAPPQEEEKPFMLEKAIIIGSFADYPAAELLANYIKAPIYTRKVAATGEYAKELIVVGGNADGLKAGKVTVLSGSDRYKTAQKVSDYIGGGK